MKLNNTLYTVTATEPTAKGTDCHIRLNPECVIYKAHFPEQPVTPGVCIVGIAHELAEAVMQRPLEVRLVKNVKFLSVISPLEVQDIVYSLSCKDDADGTLKLQATVSAGDNTYAKMSMVLS